MGKEIGKYGFRVARRWAKYYTVKTQIQNKLTVIKVYNRQKEVIYYGTDYQRHDNW